MAKRQEICRSRSGLLVRNLGWKLTPKRTYVQHKFYLGRDESAAKLASVRLARLWEQVEARWKRTNPFNMDLSNQPFLEPGTIAYELYPTDRPVWDAATLLIADAVRQDKAEVEIPLPPLESVFGQDSFVVGQWLFELQQDITVIKISLQQKEAQASSDNFRQVEGTRLLSLGRRLLRKNAGAETLFEALDAYGEYAVARYVGVGKQPTQFGSQQQRQTEFMKEHMTDCPLSEFDTAYIDACIEILRLRPQTRWGKPASVSWAQNCLKTFRRFLRWLNKSNEFSWKRPSDLELTTVRVPLLLSEKSAGARSAQVETYRLEELKLLWEQGRPFERLLLLLALNCGFGRGEIASLETADVLLRQKHHHEAELGCQTSDADSWILRMRHKTAVYGEFKLWPETVRAIDWWIIQRQQIQVDAGTTTLLVNTKGRRFDELLTTGHPNMQIPNKWNQLTKRVQKTKPDFRQLSFNKLRKTAGNLVRAEAHGEVAGIFLCHGRPVRSDELLDLYTNRPFGRVFEAIDKVGERLRPLWAGVAEPFPNEPASPRTMSLATMKQVRRMREQGYKRRYIQQELNLTTKEFDKALRLTAKAAPKSDQPDPA